MSEPEEKQFWADLQRAVARDEEAERRELAEAERFLAELDDDVEELSPERVEAIAAKALDQVARAEAPPQSGRVLSMRRARHGLAAAAAAVVAPKFLVAAAAVAALTTGALVIRYSTESLPFQEAVETMLDPSRSDGDRVTAARRVAFDVFEAIGIVGEAAATQGSAVSGNAQLEFDRVRHELDSPGTFQQTGFSTSLQVLEERVATPQLAVGLRSEAAALLTDQIVYGIRALRAGLGDPVLEESVQTFLANIRRRVGG